MLGTQHSFTQLSERRRIARLLKRDEDGLLLKHMRTESAPDRAKDGSQPVRRDVVVLERLQLLLAVAITGELSVSHFRATGDMLAQRREQILLLSHEVADQLGDELVPRDITALAVLAGARFVEKFGDRLMITAKNRHDRERPGLSHGLSVSVVSAEHETTGDPRRRP